MEEEEQQQLEFTKSEWKRLWVIDLSLQEKGLRNLKMGNYDREYEEESPPPIRRGIYYFPSGSMIVFFDFPFLYLDHRPYYATPFGHRCFYATLPGSGYRGHIDWRTTEICKNCMRKKKQDFSKRRTEF
jgi:hypothetical protein